MEAHGPSAHGHRDDWRENRLCTLQLRFKRAFRCSLLQSLATESCGSRLRREQARRDFTEDLLIVSGYRPLHMNTSTLYACFLRHPLELTLKGSARESVRVRILRGFLKSDEFGLGGG